MHNTNYEKLLNNIMTREQAMIRRLPSWSKTSKKSLILLQELSQLTKHLHKGLQRV